MSTTMLETARLRLAARPNPPALLPLLREQARTHGLTYREFTLAVQSGMPYGAGPGGRTPPACLVSVAQDVVARLLPPPTAPSSLIATHVILARWRPDGSPNPFVGLPVTLLDVRPYKESAEGLPVNALVLLNDNATSLARTLERYGFEGAHPHAVADAYGATEEEVEAFGLREGALTMWVDLGDLHRIGG